MKYLTTIAFCDQTRLEERWMEWVFLNDHTPSYLIKLLVKMCKKYHKKRKSLPNIEGPLARYLF